MFTAAINSVFHPATSTSIRAVVRQLEPNIYRDSLKVSYHQTSARPALYGRRPYHSAD